MWGYPAGSSPLARGLPEDYTPPAGRTGIIPARAGFTPRRPQGRPRRRDHPRSRGVYRDPPGSDGSPDGSSPLARGLLLGVGQGDGAVGIIPARAGFTLLLPPTYRPVTDHPRSRGVYGDALARVHRTAGSSPLARGLRWVPASWSHARGIIPARAGFTDPLLARPAPRRDHPRSRGVYWKGSVSTASVCGSSPLARGLPPGIGGPAPSPLDHPRSRGVYDRRLPDRAS